MGIFDILRRKPSTDKAKAATEDENTIFQRYEIEESDIVVSSPSCPYCKKQLEKMPTRRRKCPHCKEEIVVRTSPLSGDKVLLKEDQVAQVEAVWTEYRVLKKWIKKLNAEYGITTEQLIKKKSNLGQKFKTDPNLSDVIWGIFNDQVGEIAKANTVDYHSFKMLHFNQAMFLYETKKPFYNMLYQSSRIGLLLHQQNGVKKVKILAADNSCDVCREMNGKQFTVKNALEDMPIPHKGCEFTLDGETKGWCRCVYVPSFD